MEGRLYKGKGVFIQRDQLLSLLSRPGFLLLHSEVNLIYQLQLLQYSGGISYLVLGACSRMTGKDIECIA